MKVDKNAYFVLSILIATVHNCYSTGDIKFIHVNTKRCVDVMGFAKGVGRPLITFPCHNFKNQKFKTLPGELLTSHRYQCEDPTPRAACIGGGVKVGDQVFMHACDEVRDHNQSFQLVKVLNGRIHLIMDHINNLCLKPFADRDYNIFSVECDPLDTNQHFYQLSATYAGDC